MSFETRLSEWNAELQSRGSEPLNYAETAVARVAYLWGVADTYNKVCSTAVETAHAG